MVDYLKKFDKSFDKSEPEPEKEECPYCGNEFKSVAHHIPHCEKNTEKPSKKSDKDKIRKKLVKMFRAACNGKNYWKKWFPDEFETYGDFQAEFQDLVYKL